MNYHDPKGNRGFTPNFIKISIDAKRIGINPILLVIYRKNVFNLTQNKFTNKGVRF